MESYICICEECLVEEIGYYCMSCGLEICVSCYEASDGTCSVCGSKMEEIEED